MSAVIKELQLPYWVIDDFSPFPDAARQSALDAGFGTWKPNKGEVGSSIYEGMGFMGTHAMLFGPLMKHMWELINIPIVPNSMFFRVTNQDTEAAYVHSDREMGDYTCIVYLSEHDSESGTAFYKHRRTGRIEMPSFDEMREDPKEFALLKEEMVRGSDEDWERVGFVPGAFNRAVIFRAPLFHSRVPKHGFGDTAEYGRLVWASHVMAMNMIDGEKQ